MSEIESAQGLGNASLAEAASCAAQALVEDGDVVDMLFADPTHERFTEAAVGYLRIAPGAGPEDVYRFGAAKGLHLLPADGWADVSPEARRFFQAFTFAARGLIDGFFAPFRPAPRRLRVDAGLVQGDLGERIEADLAPLGETTASMTVTPAPAMAPPASGLPSLADLKAMTPEERRGFAGALGFPALLDELAAGKPLIASQAPAPGTPTPAGPFRGAATFVPRVIGPAEFETAVVAASPEAPPSPAGARRGGKRKA